MSSVTNPYAGLPDQAFWSRSVARPEPEAVDPVMPPPFKLSPSDRIATGGSCFAQHISRTLMAKGFRYLVTEPGDSAHNYGVFPARFGNLYTVRQLLQLFERAYGLFVPSDDVWAGKEGRFVDPFRPQIEAGGFVSPEAVREDRRKHLAAVREMFETCDVFVFTLGLTEGWQAKKDGAVFPLAPGVAGSPESFDDYEFINFDVASMVEDLKRFIEHARLINPAMRVILTVSPVPLIATYEKTHVLQATIYSKSALRVVVDMVAKAMPGVAYFPSYEIITGHNAGYKWFEPDLRSVRPAGVDHVMGLFSKHYLSQQVVAPAAPTVRRSAATQTEAELQDLYRVVCDEELLEP